MKKKKRRKGLFAAGVLVVLALGFAGGMYWGRLPKEPVPVEHVEPAFGDEESKKRMEAQGYSYAYSTLNEQERRVYDQMVDAIENRKEYVSLATTDQDVMEKSYWAMRYDHCEFFWTESYQYEVFTDRNGNVTALYFRPEFTMTEEEQKEYGTKIQTAANELLEGISPDAGDYEKALYVYRTLIEETRYVTDSEHNQNIISTFLNHETVCQGYSYGAQYLLNLLGIPCTTVCGTAEGVNHSWNLIRMDGEYYYMDVTWGEAEYWAAMDEETPVRESKDVINYSYFGVSDQDESFMRQHKPFDYIPMPVCTAVENNYFVHEGLYFDSWDLEAAGTKIREAYQAGEPVISLKFSDAAVYDQAITSLIEEGNWSRYCDEKQIGYIDGFDMNVLMLRF